MGMAVLLATDRHNHRIWVEDQAIGTITEEFDLETDPDAPRAAGRQLAQELPPDRRGADLHAYHLAPAVKRITA